MITRLQASLPNHNITLENSQQLYVVDYTHINGGKVVLLNSAPIVDAVYINNQNSVPTYFDGFDDNALEISIGNYSRQCECVLFPEDCLPKGWVLFIETKYVNCLENAFRENNDYPNCMITQVIDTVNYFRNKGIITTEKVSAIVSFPTLIEDFSASFFTGTMSIEDILIQHKIRIRATNSAEIISSKRIDLI